MTSLYIVLGVLFWLLLLVVLWQGESAKRKEERKVYGKLYVSKARKNSGSNPCNHSIEEIVRINIPEVGVELYISK